MSLFQELLKMAVSSDLAIEILEGTFNDLMVNHSIEEDEVLNTLAININDWEK